MIVLDTHALLWWTQQPGLLSDTSSTAIDSADRILVPSICFWEVALLVRRGRFALRRGQPVLEWANDVLAIPRVAAVSLTPELALSADALAMHPDPADRFIAATALSRQAPLVTKDDSLRALPWLRTVW
jgi:PIN domain nuclease of toxin-antitoxin system